MANNLSASIEEMWSRRQQVVHHKHPIFQALANTEERSTLTRGDTVHRTYRSRFEVNDMGSEGNYTRQDITDTDESLVVDKEKEVSFYIRDLDAIQTKYHKLSKTGNKYADDSGKDLYNQIDGDFIDNMSQSADGALTAVTLSTSNVYAQMTSAYRKVVEQTNDPRPSGLFAGISPRFYEILLQVVGANRATAKGDMVLTNGKVNELFDFDIYVTNSLPHTAVLAMATQVTADDTVTYNGVTFTFKASPAAAGEVDIGGDVDVSRANLAAAINGGAGAGSAYIEVSAADRLLLKNVTATNDNTANTLTVRKSGVTSHVAVSETFTDGTDEWTAASQVQHNVFGIKGATDLVIQKAPRVELKDRSGFVGKDFVSWTPYGIKTFDEGGAMLVDVPIRTDAF